MGSSGRAGNVASRWKGSNLPPMRRANDVGVHADLRVGQVGCAEISARFVVSAAIEFAGDLTGGKG